MERLSPTSFGSIIDGIQYQKSYLFRIILPNIDLDNVSLKSQDAFELCTASTAFPVMQSTVQAIPFYNSELKIQTKVTYQNWSATFRLDSNAVASTAEEKEWKTITVPLLNLSYQTWVPKGGGPQGRTTYKYFYDWQLAGYNTDNRTSNIPKKYKKSVSLILLDEMANEVPNSSFTLEGAFPVSISGANLNYADDGIVTYSVEFAFDRFIMPYKKA
jgi:hypothetical protein